VEVTGESSIMKIFIAKYYIGDPVKEDKIDGTCGPHGREVKCLWVFGGEPQGNRPFEDVGIDGIIPLKGF
jgi:hypothetical protein